MAAQVHWWPVPKGDGPAPYDCAKLSGFDRDYCRIDRFEACALQAACPRPEPCALEDQLRLIALAKCIESDHDTVRVGRGQLEHMPVYRLHTRPLRPLAVAAPLLCGPSMVHGASMVQDPKFNEPCANSAGGFDASALTTCAQGAAAVPVSLSAHPPLLSLKPALARSSQPQSP